ncbi:hypothetical protein [Nocardia harenae]
MDLVRVAGAACRHSR